MFPDGVAEAPEFLGVPPGTMLPMDTVPTSVAQGPDGSFYVGQLTGSPFPAGRANIYRVPAHGGPAVGLRRGIHRHHRAGRSRPTAHFSSSRSHGTGCLAAMFLGERLATGALIRIALDGTRSELRGLAPSLLQAASLSIVTARSTSRTRASSAELGRGRRW